MKSDSQQESFDKTAEESSTTFHGESWTKVRVHTEKETWVRSIFLDSTSFYSKNNERNRQGKNTISHRA